MSWLRNHKHTVYRAAVGAAAISLICFIWAGVNLYRNRKLLEAEIAARDYVGRGGSQGNSKGSSQGNNQGGSRGNSQGSSQGTARKAAGTAGSGTHTSLAGMWLNIVENGTGAAVM